MSGENLIVAVVGAGDKMGLRVSRDLLESSHTVLFCDTTPIGQERIQAEGRRITSTDDAVRVADVVILAGPDIAFLRDVSKGVVPQIKAGALIIILDRAADGVEMLEERGEVIEAVLHPRDVAVFLERTIKEKWAETISSEFASLNVAAGAEAQPARDEPPTLAVIAVSEYKPWQPVEDWTLLVGCDVEIVAPWGVLDKGRVDTVTADGSFLWLLQDGVYTRRVIQKTSETYARLATLS